MDFMATQNGNGIAQSVGENINSSKGKGKGRAMGKEEREMVVTRALTDPRKIGKLSFMCRKKCDIKTSLLAAGCDLDAVIDHRNVEVKYLLD